MEPFASVEEYASRYGDADDPDALAEILMDATREIRAELDRAGIPWADPDEEFAGRLMQACRSMAHRAVGDGGDDHDIPFGAKQVSEGAGSFTWSSTLGNPYGDMFMTKAERKMLGLGMSRMAYSVPGAAQCEA